MTGFADIEFGFADAQTEGAEVPDLLLRGFLDETGLTDAALSGRPFLFLGYKGSGKTAIAERARLLAEDDPTLFVTVASLADLSSVEFHAAAGAGGDLETRYPTVWAWALLLFLVQSLEADPGAGAVAPREYTAVVDGLRALDVLPVPELRRLVSKSAKRGFKAAIPKFLEVTGERVLEPQELQLEQIVAIIRRAVVHFPGSSRHVLFVDGLDDVLARDHRRYQVLAALMSEVARLNAELRAARRPFKFVVVCRQDLFDRLPGANKNKLRQDGSELLDWFDVPREPDRTRLVRLVNLRAARSLRREVNVFGEFFPRRIGERPILRHLLDHTRHQPRDVLQLMKSMQRIARTGDEARLQPADVLSGIRHYSNHYFLPELRDELSGYLPGDEIDAAVRLLTSLGRARFTLDELDAHARRIGLDGLDLDALGHTLFECSGLGMLEPGPGRPRYTFKYRNRTAVLLPDRRLLIHPGAHKALNIERGRAPGRKAPGRGGIAERT
jgi:hypothetical protein